MNVVYTSQNRKFAQNKLQLLESIAKISDILNITQYQHECTSFACSMGFFYPYPSKIFESIHLKNNWIHVY